MDGKTKLKIVGLLLLVVCVCSAFFAYERYQANAERPENKMAAAVTNVVTQVTGGKAEKPEVPARRCVQMLPEGRCPCCLRTAPRQGAPFVKGSLHPTETYRLKQRKIARLQVCGMFAMLQP